jgi:mono/diheme cytochrome c family protein
MRRLACAAGAALLIASPAAPAAGDAAKGEKLHQSCLQCHGTELYVPPKRKIQSLAALRKETVRWGDHYNPAFSKAEIDDLVAYLNRDFYKLR